MKILVLNGPNLNMLGTRERELYGEESYKELKRYIKAEAKALGISVRIKQSNCEGKLITLIQRSRGRFDGILINAGGYTHTSIALSDALRCAELPTVGVHLTDINAREDFRRTDYIALYAKKTIVGKGFSGYKEGLEVLCKGDS